MALYVSTRTNDAYPLTTLKPMYVSTRANDIPAFNYGLIGHHSSPTTSRNDTHTKRETEGDCGRDKDFGRGIFEEMRPFGYTTEQLLVGMRFCENTSRETPRP